MKALILLLSLPLIQIRTPAEFAHGIAVSPNFIVDAPTTEDARRAAAAAEKARTTFGREFLGRELTRWSVPVMLIVSDGQNNINGREELLGRTINVVHVWGPKVDDAVALIDHEVAHAVLDREVLRYVHIPRWYHEGVAVAFEVASGKKPDRYGDVVGRMALRDLFNTPGLPGYINGNAFYNQSASVVAFVRDHWGNAKLLDFYHNARTHGWEMSVPVTLGVSFDDFERMWVDSLEHGECRYP